MIEECIKACRGKRVVVQFTAHARYFITQAQGGTIGMAMFSGKEGPEPRALPFVPGDVVEYKGAFFLRVDDEAGKSGHKLLIGLNMTTVASITVVSDREEDKPSVIHLS